MLKSVIFNLKENDKKLKHLSYIMQIFFFENNEFLKALHGMGYDLSTNWKT